MDKESLIRKVNEGKSANTIAKDLGCSLNNVIYWLKKYGLKTSHARFQKTTHKCKCGETNPNAFYGHKKQICSKCHLAYNKEKSANKRLRAIQYLGGKCVACGFSKWTCSIDIHHEGDKDPNFATMRFWSWERIEKEISNCVLLCRVCHMAYHCGEFEKSW